MVNGERGREAFVRHPGKPSENQTQCSYIQSVWWVPRGALLSKMPASQPSRAHHWHSWRHGHASWHAARHRRPHLREWNAGARLLREEHAWPPSLHQYGNRGAGQGRQSSNAEHNQRPALIWLRDGLEAPTANGGHQDAREEAGCGPGAAPPPTCAGTANPAPGRAMTAAWDPPGGLPGGQAGISMVGRTYDLPPWAAAAASRACLLGSGNSSRLARCPLAAAAAARQRRRAGLCSCRRTMTA